MPLPLQDAALGLYRQADWRPGTPGIYAVVIGASNYPHIAGGKAPATKTYGFEQLSTAAHTAYRVFRWLNERFNLPSLPLASCRLLLAPTDREERLAASDATDPKGIKALTEISALATLSNCRTALRAWRDEMATLSVAAGKQSRALFMFSGHGLQASDRPLLLPADWLGPNAPTPNDAISTDNLVNGLASIPVFQQWFFCDACRASTDVLDHFRDLRGQQILEETFGAQFERSYPILYASARGMSAYEPTSPDVGCTFFGGALLDGLWPGRQMSLPCNRIHAFSLIPSRSSCEQKRIDASNKQGAPPPAWS